MPTNANAYNSRVTDEALEKRFRDTFTSQGGAELVSDLYASGVIVPTVDFTAAAAGAVLPDYLQTALDFSVTEVNQIGAGTSTITNTPGFYRLLVLATAATGGEVNIQLTNGITTKNIVIFDWNQSSVLELQWEGYIFVNTGVTLQVSGDANQSTFTTSRQVADVNGNLTDPLGFSFS